MNATRLASTIVNASAQVVIGLGAGAVIDMVMPDHPADHLTYQTPAEALLAGLEVGAQLVLVSAVASEVFQMFVDATGDPDDPQFGLAFALALAGAQPNLQAKMTALVRYVRACCDFGMPSLYIEEDGDAREKHRRAGGITQRDPLHKVSVQPPNLTHFGRRDPAMG